MIEIVKESPNKRLPFTQRLCLRLLSVNLVAFNAAAWSSARAGLYVRTDNRHRDLLNVNCVHIDRSNNSLAP